MFKGYSKEKVVRHSVGDNSNGTPTANMMGHKLPQSLLSVAKWKEITGDKAQKIIDDLSV